ncbi:tetraacyldisaccharide 4'-kinase [Rickettsiales bacterium]|nr:tetraacyldisaccharide 4'-kinase [Rickettsiales bacterium]
MIKPPKFWYKKNNIISILLGPLSLSYNLIHRIYYRLCREIKVSVPTICIGNLVIGGVGKTPVVIAIRELLSKNYKNIFVLLRGYRRYSSNVRIVNKDDEPKDVGDEAILHKNYGQVCVAFDRKEGANLCIENKADLLILDDGFQTKHIKKDISLIVCDTLNKFGNEKIFPAGPLRESIQFGLSRADAMILINNSNNTLKLNPSFDLPIFHAKKKIAIPNLKTKNIFAFCAIGSPENFYHSLSENGLNIKQKESFPDHYFYNDSDIEKIINLAERSNLEIITTEKDITKIKKIYRKKIKIAKLQIIFSSKKTLKKFLEKKFS